MDKDVSKITIMSNENELENLFLNTYDAKNLNVSPKNKTELLEKYQKYTELLYQYLRTVSGDFIFPVNNEIRAMLGHLSEYVESDEKKDKELQRAYGHLRRINLDALKIICDDFDKFFSKKMKKIYKYDYRDTLKSFLKIYAEKYFTAKNKYIDAQTKESVGSDSEKENDDKTGEEHNVILLYFDAAKEYIELKQYYEKYRKDIIKVKLQANIGKIISFLVIGFCLIVSFADIWPVIQGWILNR